MNKLLSLLTATLCLAGMSHAALPTSSMPYPVKHNDYDKNYSIHFPDNWQVQRDFMGLDVFAAAPASNNVDGSLANVSVFSGPLEGEFDLDEFLNKNLESLRKKLNDFKILETGKVAFDGFTGKKIVYTNSFNDNHTMRVSQYFIIHDQHGYVITCAAELNEYSKYASQFEKTVKSFRFH